MLDDFGGNYALTTNGAAIASLVLGILGLVVVPLAIGAIVCAFIARNHIPASEGREGGLGLATAGLTLGISAVMVWGFAILCLYALAEAWKGG